MECRNFQVKSEVERDMLRHVCFWFMWRTNAFLTESHNDRNAAAFSLCKHQIITRSYLFPHLMVLVPQSTPIQRTERRQTAYPESLSSCHMSPAFSSIPSSVMHGQIPVTNCLLWQQAVQQPSRNSLKHVKQTFGRENQLAHHSSQHGKMYCTDCHDKGLSGSGTVQESQRLALSWSCRGTGLVGCICRPPDGPGIYK